MLQVIYTLCNLPILSKQANRNYTVVKIVIKAERYIQKRLTANQTSGMREL